MTTTTPLSNRPVEIMDWLEKRLARQADKRRRLAFHYLAKSGIFPPGTVLDSGMFHLIHNWLLGPHRGNEMGEKALIAWNRQWVGHHERKSTVWKLAVARYWR